MTALTLTGSITIFVASATILTGIIVLLRDRSKNKYRALFFMALLLGLWMLANYFSNDVSLTYGLQLAINRLIFVTSAGAMASVPLFLCFLLSETDYKKAKKIFLAVGVSVMLLSATPYVVSDIVPTLPVTEVIFGPLSPLYFLSVGFFLFSGIAIFYKALKSTKGTARAQFQVVGWSLTISLVLGIVTNAVMPYIFQSFNISLIGPLFFAIMVFGFAYAIIVQRLFDVRLVIIRSFAYVLSLSVLSYLYLYIVQHIPSALDMRLDQESRSFVLGLGAFGIALTFRPLQLFFTALTSRLFYKNNYDERKIVDNLSATVISQSYQTDIADAVIKVIDSSLYPQSISIFGCGGSIQELATARVKNATQISKLLETYISKMQDDVNLTESFSSRWKRAFYDKHSIAAIVRLTSHEGAEGVMLLGFKQNGEAYTPKDIRLLATCGKSIGLALSNAKKYEEIVEFNATLEKKINEATAKLRYTNVQLSKLNELKNDFISAASHQLRPQLTSARGFTELLLTDTKLGSNEKKYAHNTIKSIDRMTSIVSGILDSATSDRQAMQLSPRRFSLSYLVREELLDLSQQIRNKKSTYCL